MKVKNTKTCLDCLHCKVSVKSTEKCRLCYCIKNVKRKNRNEEYWVMKELCNDFEDMSV